MPRNGAIALEALNAVSANICVLALDGTIVLVNRSWERFARANRLPDGQLPKDITVGSNYFRVCEKAKGASAEGARAAYLGIWEVLNGTRRVFSLEYPCHSHSTERWFLMRVSRIRLGNERFATIAHYDISDHHRAEAEISRKRLELSRAAVEFQQLASTIMGNFGETAGGASNPERRQNQGSIDRPERLMWGALGALSQRERQVLAMLAKGARNVDIGKQLNIAAKSVGTYRLRLLQKLGLKSNAELIALASRFGLP